MAAAGAAQSATLPDGKHPAADMKPEALGFKPPERASAVEAESGADSSGSKASKQQSTGAQSEEAKLLLKGMTVRLRGLKSKPELNGKEGRLVAFLEDKGRWQLTLPGGTNILLKEENLDPELSEEEKGNKTTSGDTQERQKLEMQRRPLPTEPLSPDEAVEWIKTATDEFECLLLPLQLEEDPGTIRKQFKQMSLLVHPDKNTHPDANAAFRKVFGAMETLLEPTQQRVALRKAKKAATGKDFDPDEGTRWWEQASVDEMEKAFRETEQKYETMGFFDVDRKVMSMSTGVDEEALWITAEAAKDLYDKDLVLFFDSRNTSDFDVSHVSGARAMPGHTMEQLVGIESTPAFREAVRNPEQTLIVYSDNGSKLSRCVHVSRALRLNLPKKQACRVLRLTGGLNMWKRHGFPVDGDTRALFAGQVLGNSMMRLGSNS